MENAIAQIIAVTTSTFLETSFFDPRDRALCTRKYFFLRPSILLFHWHALEVVSRETVDFIELFIFVKNEKKYASVTRTNNVY